MNLNIYVENLGKKNITIFVLIDLKKDQRRFCICNESKDISIQCIPKTDAF